jgi:cyclophilin family peptidyl-prolyl cis-trans isomerase/HEAT repeat protein
MDRELEADLENRLDSGPDSVSDRERQLALIALVRGRTARAEELVLRAALSTAPGLRATAAAAAGDLGLEEVLEILGRDPHPAVRLAVVEELLEDESGDRAAVASRALADEDPAVRTAALAWLTESPVVPMEQLLAAIEGPEARRMPDLAITGVQALAARGSERLEKGVIIAALEDLARDDEYLVRREAAEALAVLDRGQPAIGWNETDIDIRGYQEVAGRLARAHQVVIETSKGRVFVTLACDEAPLTCSSFLQLTNQGFYDGLTFHRVVPDFVVQGGDPRGDGWGGPGYSLRDEASRLRFERGVLGMARSGHHTAGSQFFITLSAQPHLDGAYTAFGYVSSGEEVLDDLIQGDRIVSMRETGEDFVGHDASTSAVDSVP